MVRGKSDLLSRVRSTVKESDLQNIRLVNFTYLFRTPIFHMPNPHALEKIPMARMEKIAVSAEAAMAPVEAAVALQSSMKPA